MQHFILTRFNLCLWKSDKNHKVIDREVWLKERVRLFETYTLPSVAAQTESGFIWVLLMDAESPEWLRERSKEWRRVCRQIRPVGVKHDMHWHFADVFRRVVVDMLVNECDRVVTTYLDNDDVIHHDYVKDIQNRCKSLPDDTFLYYDYGLQYFESMQIATKVKYPNNHFTSLVENTVRKPRTCYGYGSHFLIERYKVARVEHVKDKKHQMWVEVIHAGNVDNDVKMTFDTTLYSPNGDYAILPYADNPQMIWFAKWLPRAIQQVVRRLKAKL